MNTRKVCFGATILALSALACAGGDCPPDAESEEWSLDRRSWHIGAITAMSEVCVGAEKFPLPVGTTTHRMNDRFELVDLQGRSYRRYLVQPA